VTLAVKLFQAWQVIAKEKIMSQSIFSQWLKILADDVVTISNYHLSLSLSLSLSLYIFLNGENCNVAERKQ